jgi:hypothetical protein
LPLKNAAGLLVAIQGIRLQWGAKRKLFPPYRFASIPTHTF